jgi:hypothetical protein
MCEVNQELQIWRRYESLCVCRTNTEFTLKYWTEVRMSWSNKTQMMLERLTFLPWGEVDRNVSTSFFGRPSVLSRFLTVTWTYSSKQISILEIVVPPAWESMKSSGFFCLQNCGKITLHLTSNLMRITYFLF